MPIGYFYKWEDNNHGLEHKCGTCKTVLSSPRAKKTCLGVHEEVCTRYHKTLFFLGQSHHCDACHKTDELHDKRHREIIRLVQCIRRHDDLTHGANPRSYRKKKTTKPNPFPSPNTTSDRQETPEEPELEEWTDSSTLDEDEINRKLTRMGLPKAPESGKAAKADRKTAKHQAKMEVITGNDLDEVNNALHPDQAILAKRERQDTSQGLTHNAIENNIVFNTHTFKYNSLRTDVHHKKVAKANLPRRGTNLKIPEQRKAFVDPILQALGLNSNLTSATKDRKALDAKLRAAIYQDILAVTNEQAETMQRMAGYWRYVNRSTYNAMVRMNEIWDWATGAKLPEIEEENGISDVAGSESDSTLVGSTDLESLNTSSPTAKAESNIRDFDVADDITPVTLIDATDSYISTSIGEGVRTPTKASVYPEAGHGISSESDGARSLSYSPGRLPGPTITFSVPSPSSSDEFWDGPDVCLEENVMDIIFAQSPNRKLFFKPSSMWASSKTSVEIYGDEDHRFEDEASYLPSSTERPSAPKEKKQPLHRGRNPWAVFPPARETLVAKDLNNRFKGLKIETAVPREEADLENQETPRSMPVKRIFASSSSFTGVDVNENFPALPQVDSAPHKSTGDAPKPKIISIGISAVELVDAKTKSTKKRFPKISGKTSSCLRASARSTNLEHNNDGAWMTVENGRRR